MRWLFLVLLLLNLLYALWNWQHVQVLIPDGVEIRMPAVAASSSPAVEQVAVRAQSTAVESPEQGVSLCMMLGPIELLAQAQQIRQRMLALNVEASVRSLRAAGRDQYWLLLENVLGESPAQSMARLRAAGFDGFQVVDGPFAGRIALGMHDDAGYAQARRAQIESHGFVVNQQTASAAKDEYWVEVSATSRRLVDQRMLGTLRRDFSGLQHQFRPCTVSSLGRG